MGSSTVDTTPRKALGAQSSSVYRSATVYGRRRRIGLRWTVRAFILKWMKP